MIRVSRRVASLSLFWASSRRRMPGRVLFYSNSKSKEVMQKIKKLLLNLLLASHFASHRLDRWKTNLYPTLASFLFCARGTFCWWKVNSLLLLLLNGYESDRQTLTHRFQWHQPDKLTWGNWWVGTLLLLSAAFALLCLLRSGWWCRWQFQCQWWSNAFIINVELATAAATSQGVRVA